MSFFVPTRFVWRFGGRQVHLCGSFTRWVETIPMAPVDGTPGVFAVVVHLPPGYHQYKFIVDGKWMHDETAPYMPDPLGNVNNWLFVRKIDPPAAQPGIMFEQQQLLHQLQEQQQQAAAAINQQAVQAVAAQHAAAQQQQQQAAQAQAQAQAAQQQQLQQQQQTQQQQQQQLSQAAAYNQRAAAAAAAVAAAAAAASAGAVPGQPGGSAGAGSAAAGGGGLQSGLAPALQAPQPQHMQLPGGGSGGDAAAAAAPAAPAAAGSPGPAGEGGDVDMAAADSVVAPIIIHNEREPDLTKKKVSDFLHSHSAYELIPESGKVVLLDLDLPIRQAFHALHEQGIASAPLWDGTAGAVVGVISASDFIITLRRLRSAVSSGNNPLSEAEMDAHTIRGMREEGGLEGRPAKPLVYVRPTDNLAKVVRTLFDNKCSMAPILSADPSDPAAGPGSGAAGEALPTVLHIASLSGVLTCLMRHFRASLASLPLLAQPLGQLPIGTWAPDHQFPAAPGAAAAAGPPAAAAAGLANGAIVVKGSSGSGTAAAAAGSRDGAGGSGGGRNVSRLHAVTPGTPLTTALGMLLDAGVSALPVVNEAGVLLDIYARADITKLCKGNAYNRLQWEDVTVGQALSLASPNPAAWSQASASSGGHLLVPDYAVQAPLPNPHLTDSQLRGGAPGGSFCQTLAGGRVAVAYQDDPLRAVVERLAAPGVRRLVVVDRSSRRVQGLVSLSDVAAYLFL